MPLGAPNIRKDADSFNSHACWRQLRTEAAVAPPLLIHGHPPAKPDTQFGSHAPARFRKPLCSHKVAFKTLRLSNCPSFHIDLP
jgi:hypothetical protein